MIEVKEETHEEKQEEEGRTLEDKVTRATIGPKTNKKHKRIQYADKIRMTWTLSLVAPHELTEEEKLQILHSEEFMDFFDHSTRIVERALSEHVDVFFDYSGRDLEEKEGYEMKLP